MYLQSEASGPDDTALVRRALDGDTDAFGLLVARYQHVMYTLALRMLGNAEDAQDVTQDAFVKAYRQLASFDPSFRFFSWLYRIVVNECLNLIRSRHPHETLDADVAGRNNPYDDTLAVERGEQIQQALQRLTPDTARWSCCDILPGNPTARSPRRFRSLRRP